MPDYELKLKQPTISTELFKAELIVSIELINHESSPTGNVWLIVGDEENTLLFCMKISVGMFDTADHCKYHISNDLD